ncbi:VanW family protein [Actinopolymorpha singaporensis]|uniref:Vancomycin resistance protein VanW n=1 Tax=Actinopolymorpha singaporensis TaxID=117157 RepID=A0A1H1Y5S0_9ACTN|nr:VanW family protein [Actinopolymorpha singaporensis]SDT16735.1 vancomycin resistance protein VanW [Actinopolymorpha singaporensis]
MAYAPEQVQPDQPHLAGQPGQPNAGPQQVPGPGKVGPLSAEEEALLRSLVADGWELPVALTGRRRRVAQVAPALYPLAVAAHRARRRVRWLTSRTRWAHERAAEPLPVRVKRHNSLLLRQLGESEMWLQHNKVANLRLAAPRVAGLLIRPGETLSFCRTVGKATRRRGYVDGMLLSNGKARAGLGGGICQLANLLHWMVLHSPLTVVERSAHGWDPFPDNGRVIPWGTGCAVFYNYVDLQVRNDTDATFQVLAGVGDRYLEGELRADRELPHSYSVYARDEQFLTLGGRHFRRNEIWRSVIDRRTGNRVREELLKRNFALATYVPKGFEAGQAGSKRG